MQQDRRAARPMGAGGRRTAGRRYAWPLLAAGLALAAGCAGAPPRQYTTTGGTEADAVPTPPQCPARAAQARAGGGPDTGPFVAGAPVVATVCRYAGLNAPHRPGELTGTRVLRGDDLAAVRAGLDRQRPVTGTYSCPADDGSAHLLQFAYRDGSVVRIRVSDTGCRFATNGRRAVRVPEELADGLDA